MRYLYNKSKVMKLFESFRSAADKYREALAREMLTAGIPDKYLLATC